MRHKRSLFLLAFIIVPILFTHSFASVGWDIKKTLHMEKPPLDVAVSLNGKWIFVLADPTSILVYSADGRLNDTIHISDHIDKVEVGPRENILLLTSRQKKTVQVITLEFSQNIAISGSPFKGPADAPVTIVVFSDFECPYCLNLSSLLDQVFENNYGQVKIVFKNFPLRSHKFALKAATAALVANRQGKFWEFHDQLFNHYDCLSDEKIQDIVRELGLDEAEFEKQMKDSKILKKIQRDTRDGKKVGVRGVPAVFINGKRLKKRNLEAFQSAIEKELKGLQEKMRVPLRK